MGRVPRSLVHLVFCFLWCVGIVWGVYEINVYGSTPTATSAVSREWPSGTSLRRAVDRPTLVMALHPGCACSRATLEELSRLLAETRTPPRVEILLYQPKGAREFEPSSLGRQARLIPGVHVVADPAGDQSARFGLSVSGQTAIFGPDGELLFTGGLTQGRGHVGDNDGRRSAWLIASGQQPLTASTPVFGCSIRDRR